MLTCYSCSAPGANHSDSSYLSLVTRVWMRITYVIFKWSAKALSCSQISKSVWAYKQWSTFVCILIQPSVGISCPEKNKNKKTELCLCKVGEDMFHHTWKYCIKEISAVSSLFRCFRAGGKEPRKQQNTHEDHWTFTHLSKHICPFRPIFQFIFFWTFCLCPSLAFGDERCRTKVVSF